MAVAAVAALALKVAGGVGGADGGDDGDGVPMAAHTSQRQSAMKQVRAIVPMERTTSK